MNKLSILMKVIVLALIEGVSEWLPISSSGHLLLFDIFINLEMPESFKELFFILVQLGAIIAVVVVFFKKIVPIQSHDKNITINRATLNLWIKIFIACAPGAIVAILLDNYVDDHFDTPLVISIMLILYGVIFLFIENLNFSKRSKITSLSEINYRYSFFIGMFQMLSIIPGTSRSGITIIGGILLGLNKEIASEFSFYLAIPVMLGYSMIKLLKIGLILTVHEILLLFIGMLVSFLISVLVIKFILKYLTTHSFKIFGIYRIILGVIVIIFFR